MGVMPIQGLDASRRNFLRSILVLGSCAFISWNTVFFRDSVDDIMIGCEEFSSELLAVLCNVGVRVFLFSLEAEKMESLFLQIGGKEVL